MIVKREPYSKEYMVVKMMVHISLAWFICSEWLVVFVVSAGDQWL